MERWQQRLKDICNRPEFTLWQKKVYGVVSEIPEGETRSYKWVAARAGSPGGGRAVGDALSKNPYPVLIPCHRVIREDGSLGGYSRALEIKERLLALEHGEE